MYDNYTREEKIKYWRRLNRRFSNEELGRKASRIKERMLTNPNYTPPFEGDELREGEYWDAYRHRDVSEYNEFTNEEKRKYHARMQSRPRRRGGKGKNRWDKGLGAFHSRMWRRALKNLPTYLTPEAEKEAEE